MCGIAGILHYREPARPVDRALLEAMTRSLAHRGPDGEGIWLDSGIGLGHRRLAILDLSDAARQPMADPAGGHVITYNGEIYNFRELRDELEGYGYRFRSTSDTEVILAGYAAWGEDVVHRLSGIYAFAIRDARQRSLFLARDPLGVKPLFYNDDGQTFRFGSEVKAILTDPDVSRDWDEAALDAFLTFSYTPAPATGYRHVRQLLPGHLAVIDERGMRIRRFRDPPYDDRVMDVDFASGLREFRERFDRVTQNQMISDVPVGGFLSGGLDSAAVVRAMKQVQGADVHALTVGFDLPGFDERDAARASAASIGVSLDEQTLSVDAASLLPHLSRHMEEPTADSSMLPVYLLCQAARERFTVAMSGDGADEILAGYDTYRATQMARYYRCLPGLLRRGVCMPLARAIPIRDRKYSLHQVATRFTNGAELGPGRDHCAWRIVFDDRLKQRLYAPSFRQRAMDCDPIGDYAARIDEVPAAREHLAGLLHADTAFYLPNDMLVKVDRMSMAHGLEVRVPFLDVELVRWCANLPGGFKLHRGKVRKHILRESLRDTLPPRVLDRPKSGFNLPVESWMRGPLRELLLDSVRTHRHDLGAMLDTAELERVADEHRDRRADHAHALFTVMMLGLWLDNRANAWKNISSSSMAATR